MRNRERGRTKAKIMQNKSRNANSSISNTLTHTHTEKKEFKLTHRKYDWCILISFTLLSVRGVLISSRTRYVWLLFRWIRWLQPKLFIIGHSIIYKLSTIFIWMAKIFGKLFTSTENIMTFGLLSFFCKYNSFKFRIKIDKSSP